MLVIIRKTHLTSINRLAPENPAGGELEIHGLIDNHGRLATELVPDETYQSQATCAVNIRQ